MNCTLGTYVTLLCMITYIGDNRCCCTFTTSTMAALDLYIVLLWKQQVCYCCYCFMCRNGIGGHYLSCCKYSQVICNLHPLCNCILYLCADCCYCFMCKNGIGGCSIYPAARMQYSNSNLQQSVVINLHPLSIAYPSCALYTAAAIAVCARMASEATSYH